MRRAPRFTQVPWTPAEPTVANARGEQTAHVELEIDRALLHRAATDHSPSRRPEIRGAQDTFDWNRYGYHDGDGDDNFVIGRDAISRNRDPR